MNNIVKNYLFTYNQIEKQQLSRNAFVLDIPLNSYEDQAESLVLLKEYFLKNDKIYISKHPRFAAYPEHTHHFLELNYVLSGESHQTINGNKEVIHQGELLLLDRGSSHSLEIHERNDILINIIFPSEKMDIDWLSTVNHENNILFDFLVQNLTDHSRKQYLIFRCSENQHIQMILTQMIEKYFTGTVFSNEIISMYIPILFTELIGNCQYDFHHERHSSQNNQVIVDTLQLIEADYMSISLEKAADQLGYNKNYLSNLVKKKTGYTFSSLVMRKRMQQAKFLIENSSLPIHQIIEQIGLQNKSHFYRQFKTEYGCLPNSLREHNEMSS